MKKYLSLIALFSLCIACEEERETYPSIVTEMADAHVNSKGTLYMIETDKGTQYTLTNPQTGFKADRIYRTLSGFVPEADGRATLYQMSGAYLLRDSSAVGRHDATGVLSAWRAGRYINLHLKPKTQGGTQYWGFTLDHATPGHARISLHHSQNGDAPSYSEEIYASIPVDSIPGTAAGDTLTLTVQTYDGPKTWTFKK